MFQRADPAKHVLLLKVTPNGLQAFATELDQALGAARNKSALLFVHGYNVSFEDAARRAAQMSHDLGFRGTPLMYSWPSRASVPRYTVDEANIRWTTPHLQEFLSLIANKTEVEAIHVVAHSMGNRAVTEVLRRFAVERLEGRKPPFGKVVLVAPDVDAQVFRDELVPVLSTIGDGVTLYASAHDKALAASEIVHSYVRAGDASKGILVAENLVTIDASDVDTSLMKAIKLGHSYFAEEVEVINDISALLAGVVESARGLQALSSGPKPYWKVLASDP